MRLSGPEAGATTPCAFANNGIIKAVKEKPNMPSARRIMDRLPVFALQRGQVCHAPEPAQRVNEAALFSLTILRMPARVEAQECALWKLGHEINLSTSPDARWHGLRPCVRLFSIILLLHSRPQCRLLVDAEGKALAMTWFAPCLWPTNDKPR